MHALIRPNNTHANLLRSESHKEAFANRKDKPESNLMPKILIDAADTEGRAEHLIGTVAALTLDLDDTLWDFKLAVQGAEKTLHAWLLKEAPSTSHLLPTPAALQRYRKRAELDRPDLRYRLDLVRRESIRQVLLDSDANLALADAGYEIFYAARQNVHLFDDVVPSLKWLSARYPLIAITNGNSNLVGTSIRQFFMGVLVAQEFGCAKPDQRIFQAAAQMANAPTSRILHIGDDLELDYQGARDAGLQAAWLVRPGIASPRSPTSEWRIQDLYEVCQALAHPGELVPPQCT